MNQSFSDRVRISREEEKLSQQDLAEAAGISRSAISQLEAGDTKSFRPENLFPIARRLNREAEWLATGKGQKKPQDKPPGYKVFDPELFSRCYVAVEDKLNEFEYPIDGQLRGTSALSRIAASAYEDAESNNGTINNKSLTEKIRLAITMANEVRPEAGQSRKAEVGTNQEHRSNRTRTYSGKTKR